MAGFKCPFCNMFMVDNDDTHKIYSSSFVNPNRGANSLSTSSWPIIQIHFYKCPNCSETTIYINGDSADLEGLHVSIRPRAIYTQFPDYIPESIRNDYMEACLIKDLSPKASATLSRRCLQGMIRDFWSISKNTLFNEILELKDKVPLSQWKVIDNIRTIGNIGAHMEKEIGTIIDIDPYEAERLILLIERLIKYWYIDRHDQDQLDAEIIEIGQAKNNQKSKSLEESGN